MQYNSWPTAAKSAVLWSESDGPLFPLESFILDLAIGKWTLFESYSLNFVR